LATSDASLALGRRKESIAHVRLTPGEGRVTVNEKDAFAYFGRKVLEQAMLAPLRSVNMLGRFDVAVRVTGGGMTGQAGAATLGIARALLKADIDLRPVLKSHGFLTRDARVKERKKPGLKKARKAPQYTKR
jgi:small subunit ribosomal protein S9